MKLSFGQPEFAFYLPDRLGVLKVNVEPCGDEMGKVFSGIEHEFLLPQNLSIPYNSFDKRHFRID